MGYRSMGEEGSTVMLVDAEERERWSRSRSISHPVIIDFDNEV